MSLCSDMDLAWIGPGFGLDVRLDLTRTELGLGLELTWI